MTIITQLEESIYQGRASEKELRTGILKINKSIDNIKDKDIGNCCKKDAEKIITLFRKVLPSETMFCLRDMLNQKI